MKGLLRLLIHFALTRVQTLVTKVTEKVERKL